MPSPVTAPNLTDVTVVYAVDGTREIFQSKHGISCCTIGTIAQALELPPAQNDAVSDAHDTISDACVNCIVGNLIEDITCASGTEIGLDGG